MCHLNTGILVCFSIGAADMLSAREFEGQGVTVTQLSDVGRTRFVYCVTLGTRAIYRTAFSIAPRFMSVSPKCVARNATEAISTFPEFRDGPCPASLICLSVLALYLVVSGDGLSLPLDVYGAY